MIIHSDWHVHSEYSFDATLPLEEIAEKAKELGLNRVGVTDHVNFNDKKFLRDLQSSAKCVKELQKNHPEIVLGVELTPIEKPEFDYIEKNGAREGYVPPVFSEPYALELALTKEQLMKLGVRYAIGGTHWRVDVPHAKELLPDRDAMILEWYRQQMWLACDERVTVLGHPWCNSTGIWYDDFSVIPRSMNLDIASALKENGKYVECNEKLLYSPKTSEKFRKQYAEFIRELFELGIPVTYGSDSHKEYALHRLEMESLLAEVGFSHGDFYEIKEEDFWR